MHATISKEFAFSASHVLSGLAHGHPCGRIHGHNYTIRVSISGWVNPDTGFVIDYRELGFVKDYLDEELDHRHLNDVVDFQPSAEHLARHLHTFVVGHLRAHADRGLSITIGVSETPKTWAVYPS